GGSGVVTGTGGTGTVTGTGGTSSTGAGGDATGAGGTDATGAGGTSTTGSGGTNATGSGGASTTGAGGATPGESAAGGCACAIDGTASGRTTFASLLVLLGAISIAALRPRRRRVTIPRR
ncbi:MAG TPA: hypothetical protein VIF57_21790, partial [Polyangia bacterium]